MRIPHLARTQQLIVAGALALAVIGLTGPSAAASSPGADNRLTHDDPGSAGYVSNST